MTYGVNQPDYPEGYGIFFGGSGGLGGAAARLAAERGSDIVLTYASRPEAGEEAAEAIRALGRRCVSVWCDVRDRASVSAVIDEASKLGRIHTIVAAHGAPYGTGPLADMNPDVIRDRLEGDIMGFVHIVQMAIPHLRAGGGGTITAVGSVSRYRSLAGYSMPGSAKTAVANLIRFVAREEGPYNIRANAIAPGVIDSGLGIALRDSPSKVLLEKALAGVPLGRAGLSEEVAELICFLSSAKSGYITGQEILVDGGHCL